MQIIEETDQLTRTEFLEVIKSLNKRFDTIEQKIDSIKRDVHYIKNDTRIIPIIR